MKWPFAAKDQDMADEPTPKAEAKPLTYQVRIQGFLDADWADWLGGLTLTLDEGDTLLTGSALDQAALYGLIKKVRDAGLTLISVNPIGKNKPGADRRGAPLRGTSPQKRQCGYYTIKANRRKK
jgi:hypothetical protein